MTDAYERAKRDDEQWEREHGDTSEKLEADIERIVKEYSLYWLRTFIIEWLERQAAITRRETRQNWQDAPNVLDRTNLRKIAELQAKVDELQAKLDSAKYNCLTCDAKSELQRKVDDLQAENDEWRELYNEMSHERCDALMREDELKAQLDEYDQTHMKLPVDADGVPIRVGERMRLDNGHEGEVWLIGAFDIMMSDHTCFDWAKSRHVKPRTIEDVLEEFIAAYDEWDDNCHDDREGQRQAVFEKYADELRGMGVCDE